MAIGKITVRPVRAVRNNTVKQTSQRPVMPPAQMPPTQIPPAQIPPKQMPPAPLPVPPPQINPFLANNAVSRINVCIAAASVAQAEDFLCGLYCNAVDDLGESAALIYTRDRKTLSMLTDTKQKLQRMVARPSGTVIMGGAASEQASFYQLTVANAGVQRGAVDIFFICCPYSQLASFSSSDVIAVILNATSPDREEIRTEKPVNYIITGFEKERTYYFEEGDSPPCEALRERLKQITGVRLKAGDRVSYAQVYGGASVTAVEGGSPIYSVANNCRDYVPTGCGRVFFNLLIDFSVRRNIHTGVFASICAELEKVLGKDGAARESWHEVYPEGKGEKQ